MTDNHTPPNWTLVRAAQLIDAERSGMTPFPPQNPDGVALNPAGRALARYIEQHEEEPVDPDVLLAREIVANDQDTERTGKQRQATLANGSSRWSSKVSVAVVRRPRHPQTPTTGSRGTEARTARVPSHAIRWWTSGSLTGIHMRVLRRAHGRGDRIGLSEPPRASKGRLSPHTASHRSNPHDTDTPYRYPTRPRSAADPSRRPHLALAPHVRRAGI